MPIKKSRRRQRRRTSKKSTSRRKSPQKGHRGFFKRGSRLSAQQKKYCSCIAKVKRRSGGRSYNPYAICAKSTGTSMGRRGCLQYYNFSKTSRLGHSELSNIMKNERKALSKYRRSTPRRKSSRKSPTQSQMLKRLASLVKSKYKY